MLIGSIRHKGLKRLFLSGDASRVPPASLEKLRGFWRLHQLSGNRSGVWSAHVTANWRLTFIVSGDPPVVDDIDLEDYH